MNEQHSTEMPMCDACKRPLGLFYAECLTCLGNADLHGTYYAEWCEWQKAQRVAGDGNTPNSPP